MLLHKVYIANVTPSQCADWLHAVSIQGGTITQGFGYWEGVLEPQCTVELTGDNAPLAAFIDIVFENTEERAVYYVGHNMSMAGEIYRKG